MLQFQALGSAAGHGQHDLRGVLQAGTAKQARRVATNLVEVVLHTFWSLFQGDIEIKHGRKPVPIMNRAKFDQQAIHQVSITVTEKLEISWLKNTTLKGLGFFKKI